MKKRASEKVLDLVRRAGVLRPRDLDRYRIPRVYIQRLLEEGKLERVGRGLYVIPGAELSQYHSLAEAAKRVSHGTICLLSALRLHEITTQNPHEVWMAIGEKDRLPKVTSIPMRFVRFSGPALREGVEERTIEGVTVRVYSAAKTVADLFKYRNKTGLDVALEALRDALRVRKATYDEIWHYAGICRVANVMRPYMEAVQ
jgi:predicted transcriptional regulator of viral defense system